MMIGSLTKRQINCQGGQMERRGKSERVEYSASAKCKTDKRDVWFSDKSKERSNTRNKESSKAEILSYV